MEKLTHEQANKKAKELFIEWKEERTKIARENKDKNFVGLDSSNYLYKEINEKYKKKLDDLKKQVDN